MLSSDLFRFMVIRPPQRQAEPGRQAPVIKAFPDARSPFAQQLAQLPPAKAQATARDFIASGAYVADLAQLKIPLAALDLALLPPAVPDEATIDAAVRRIFAQPPEHVAADKIFRAERERLADSLLAAVVSAQHYVPGQERLVRALQLCALVETLADPATTTARPAATLRGLVVLPRLHPSPGPAAKAPPPAPTPEQQAYERGLSETGDLRVAIDELRRLLRRKQVSFGVREQLTGKKKAEQPAPTMLEKGELARLSPATKRVFKAFQLPAAGLDIGRLSSYLEQYLNAELPPLLRWGAFPPWVPMPRLDPFVPTSTGRVRVAGIGDLLVVRQRIKRYELGEIAHIANALRGELYGRTFRRNEASEVVEFEELEQSETTERDLQSTSKNELKSEVERTIQEDLKFEAGVTVTASGPAIEVSANAGFSYERSTEETVNTATTFARDVVDRSLSRVQERVLQRRSSTVTREVEETTEHRIDNSGGPDHLIGIYRWVEKIYEAQIVNYGRRLILELVVPEPAAFYRHAQQGRRPPGVLGEPPAKPQVYDTVRRRMRDLTVHDITEDNYLDWVSAYQLTGVNPPPPDILYVGTALEQPAKDGDRDSASKIIEQGGLKVADGYIATEIHVDWAGEADSSATYWELIVGTEAFKQGTSMVRMLRSVRYTSVIPVSLVVKNYGSFTANIVVRCDRGEGALQRWKMDTFSSIMARYAKLKADYDDQVAAAQIQGGVGIGGRSPLANRLTERAELKRLAITMLSGQNFDLFNAMSDSGEPLRYPQVENFAEAQAEGEYIQFLEQAIEWHHMTYVFYPYFWGRKPGWVELLNSEDADELFAQFLRAGAARVQVPVRPGFVEAIEYFLREGRPWNGGTPPHFEDDDDAAGPPFIPIMQELREQTGAEFEEGPGALQARAGDVAVTGLATAFAAPEDVDREIRIAGRVYRIRRVAAAGEITLYEPYAGPDGDDLPYALGPRLVGQPWEVRLPTTLVMLQPDATLPEY